MKDARLIITILTGITLVLATIMVSLNIYPSWSQFARSLEEPLLFATLISISFMFIIKAYSFEDRDLILFRAFGIPVRSKHINKATGIFFALVLIFPVTHDYLWISNLHLVFTALAIGSAYLEVCFYSRTLLAYIGTALAITLFLGAYLLKWYSVGMGELFAASPIAVFILWNIKKIDNN